MAIVRTKAETITKPRLEFLILQIMYALNATSSDYLDATDMANIQKGLGNKWLDGVKIYLLNNKKDAILGMIISIDWDTHKIEIDNGKDTITVAANHEQLPMMVQTCNMINDFAEKYKTQSKVSFTLSDRLSEAQKQDVRNEFGWVVGRPQNWAGAVAPSGKIPNKILQELSWELILTDAVSLYDE